MRKMLLAPLLFLFFLSISVFVHVTFAATPSNTMTFGGTSSNLPGKEMGDYFKKAWPEMKKIHGEPFSSFTFTVEGRPDIAAHGGGWYVSEKKVVFDTAPMRNYEGFRKEHPDDPQAGLGSVEQLMIHELSHAMYTYGDLFVGFPYSWTNEGWAKTTELITWMRTKGELPRPGIYLTQFLDKDTLAGTQGLGRYKQNRNHPLIYDNLTIASLNLLYGCSDSNLNPDFQIRMDNQIYDDYIVGKKPLFLNKKITEEDYINLIKTLCKGRKIDGQDASQWYFSQPANFTNGSTGFHLGMTPHWWVYTTTEGIDIYTFNRVQNTEDQDKTEKGISAQVLLEIFDVNGNSVFSKTTQTDQNGDSFVNFGRDLLKNGAYYAIAKSTYQGKQYQSKIFFTNIRDKDGTADEQKLAQNPNEVIGVMVDKNLTPLSSKYLALLKPVGNVKITANSNGVILAETPSTETKEVAFDFLGQTFTFTKPPFWREIVFKVTDDQIKRAQSSSGFKDFTDKGFAKTSKMQPQSGKVEEAKTPFERLIEMIKSLFSIR